MPRQQRAGVALVLLILTAWLVWAVAGGSGFSVADGWPGADGRSGPGQGTLTPPGLPPADGTGGPTHGSPGGSGSSPDGGEEPPDWVQVPDRGWAMAVDVDRQRAFVYHDGELARTMVCSTGMADKPTPVGEFRIQNRGEWFYSEKYKQGGRWWVSFHNWGEYLFHSVPMDREGRLLEEEAARLGYPASHGCVRLSLEDAEWVYRNVPAGAPVTIR
ncbi:MAG: L,D-transpeptidase [Bacillota bacterium]|nr:L,D-transpeptidase [Bacillota bacterium]